MKELYICRDEDGTLIKFHEKPYLVIPLDRNEKEYWDAPGDFEILKDSETFKLLIDKCCFIKLPYEVEE